MFGILRRIFGLTLLICAATVSARAYDVVDQIVVDNFSVDTPLLSNVSPAPDNYLSVVSTDGQPTDRVIQVSTQAGFVNGQVVSDDFSYGVHPSSLNGNLGTLSYSTFTADLSSTPILALDFNYLTGTGTAFVDVQSKTGTTTDLSQFYTLPNSSSGYLFIGLREMPGYSSAFLDQVDSLQISIGGGNSSYFAYYLGEISFVSPGLALAIPEPTPCLIAWPCALLLGMGLVSRRFAAAVG